MSEFTKHSGFVINLERCGDPGSAYRTQGNPRKIQWQHLVDRGAGSDLTVQGDLVKVIHGHMSGGQDPATLIVVEFRFISSDDSRRFRKAEIELLFAESTEKKADDTRDPELVNIAPSGKYSMNQTNEKHIKTYSVGASVAGGGIPSLGANVGWQMNKSFNKEYCTSITGAMRIEGRNSGGKNLARWVLLENPSARDGIATLLRSAILIRRKNNDNFTAAIKIVAKVDIQHKLQSFLQDLLGKTPHGDPVFFDPSAMPLGDLPEGIDIENLSEYDLMKLVSVEHDSSTFLPT